VHGVNTRLSNTFLNALPHIFRCYKIREADDSPPPPPQVKNEWSYTYAFAYALMLFLRTTLRLLYKITKHDLPMVYAFAACAFMVYQQTDALTL